MDFKAEIVKKVRKISDRAKDEHGYCSACGSDSHFVYNSWVLDSKLQQSLGNGSIAADYLYRESMFCSKCNSSYRVRRLCDELLAVYQNQAKNLVEMMKQDYFTKLRILEVNEIGSFGSLHKILSTHPMILTTEFIVNGNFGEFVNGKAIENFEKLSFESNSFDLVIHSDTLEHIPTFELAKDEMYRVLKPGGYAVFTIPVISSIESTYKRVKVNESGGVESIHPPVYHGRAGGPYRFLPAREDYLEMTTFGSDASQVLDADSINLEVKSDTQKQFTSGSDMVFVARKA
jgi:SAM-dependent methyltransferase